ncbi:PIR protein [Plasmodium vivax]|uniref:VIR protein n=1 Tax=Plasmodium vivax TaxID=5855 RepID=A0A565A4U5_PLAVI|nr:PIR protein [Plasmodium vivax]
MSHHRTKYDLDQLTSKFHYNYFDNEQRNCYDVQFHSNIKDDLKQYRTSFKDISDKLIKGLCFIYNKKINNLSQFDNEWCSYLYYWLGYNILQNLSDKSLFRKIIRMIYGELNSSGMYSICNYLYEKIDENTFDTYKLLFDYSKDHENFNLSTSYGYTTCDEHYKKVMIDYINTYRDAHKNCTENNEKNYDCEYFKKLFSKDLYAKLTTFTCTERQNGGTITEKQRENKVQEAALTEYFPLAREMASTFQHNTARGSGLVRYHNTQFQENTETTETLPMIDTAEGSSSKSIVGSVVPVLGVSSFSLLLYKVTPVGGYINRLLGRNRNVYNNIEYMDAFNPYSDGMVPGDRRMNISYHRI